MASIAVVILNWNDAVATIAACQSVLDAVAHAAEKLRCWSIWIVDNGSEADDVLQLTSWLDNNRSERINYVANDVNKGFGAGMNSGVLPALQSELDYVLLLNNDLVLDRGSISHLVDFSGANPNAAIVGLSVVSNRSGCLESAGGYYYYPSLAFSRPNRTGVIAQRSVNPGSAVRSYVDGAAVWLQAHFLRRIAGVPQCHFLFFEELELAQRLLQEETMDFCCDAVVLHDVSGSLKTTALRNFGAYHAALSAFEYTWSYHRLFILSVVFVRLAVLAARSVISRQPGMAIAGTRALFHFIKSRFQRY